MSHGETKLLWVDQDHMWIWDTTIEWLGRDGFRIDTLTSIDEGQLPRQCEGMDGLVLHCGTVTPIAGLVEILSQVKAENSKLKLILETNVRHPAVEHMVDDYIVKPIRPSELVRQLKDLFGR